MWCGRPYERRFFDIEALTGDQLVELLYQIGEEPGGLLDIVEPQDLEPQDLETFSGAESDVDIDAEPVVSEHE